jgi:hypothetical protein
MMGLSKVWRSKVWQARHPLWTFHFAPTSAPSPIAVAGLFAKLTGRRLNRGVLLRRRTRGCDQPLPGEDYLRPALLQVGKRSTQNSGRRKNGAPSVRLWVFYGLRGGDLLIVERLPPTQCCLWKIAAIGGVPDRASQHASPVMQRLWRSVI